MAAFFYTDEGLLTSSRLDRLQAELGVLEGLFNMVDLHNNIYKTAGMLCHPCYIVDGHPETVYTR